MIMLFFEMLPLQLRGECLEQYVAAAQDTTKNAQSKSLLAAYNCWHEQLKAEQTMVDLVIFILNLLRHNSNGEHLNDKQHTRVLQKFDGTLCI